MVPYRAYAVARATPRQELLMDKPKPKGDGNIRFIGAYDTTAER